MLWHFFNLNSFIISSGRSRKLMCMHYGRFSGVIRKKFEMSIVINLEPGVDTTLLNNNLATSISAFGVATSYQYVRTSTYAHLSDARAFCACVCTWYDKYCWERRNMDPGLNPSGRLVGPVIRTYTRHFWRSPREPEEQSY